MRRLGSSHDKLFPSAQVQSIDKNYVVYFMRWLSFNIESMLKGGGQCEIVGFLIERCALEILLKEVPCLFGIQSYINN